MDQEQRNTTSFRIELFTVLASEPPLSFYASLKKYFVVLFQENNSQGGNNTDDGPSATRIIARVCSVIIRLGTKVVEQGKRSFLVTGWTMVEASSNAGLAAPSENAEERAESIHGEGEGKAPADAIGRVEAICFPQFDIVQSPPPDHRYLDNVGQVRN